MAKIAVIANAIIKNVLWLNFLNLIMYHVNSIAINNNIGFITLEPNGVLAANKTFHAINQTIRTKASGQLVINHVIFHTHFTFCNADNISSILNHTKNINTIIHEAHKNDSFILPHKKIADPRKKTSVIPHIVKSNFWSESKSNFFINKLIIKFK